MKKRLMWLAAVICLTSAEVAVAQMTVYTNEQEYLDAIGVLGYVQRQDGFENNDYWGLLETDTAPDVTSQGITWSALGGGLNLNHNTRDTGQWGLNPSPAGLPVNGFTGSNTGSQTLFGLGGWVRSGTTSDIFLYLNGSNTPIHDDGVGSTHTFFGVIDLGGINSFEFSTEAVGGGDPAKEIYVDNFTFGFNAAPSIREPGTDWINSSGGVFNTGSNWDGGANPIAGTNARFNLGSAAPYTVGFSQNETIGQAIIGNDNLRFDLGGNQLDLTQTNITRESLIVGELAGESATLSVENGFIAGANVVVAHSNGSTGQLNIQNGGSVSLSGAMRVGSGGTGSLDIATGSQVTSLRGVIGQLNGIGNVTVDGAAAQWNAGQQLDVGLGGTGSLTVSNAANVTASLITAGRKAGNGLANEPVGAGTLNLSGSGTTLDFATMSIALDGAGSASITGGAQANGRGIVLGTANSGSTMVDGTGSTLSAFISGASRGTLTVGRGNTLRASDNSNVHTTLLDITGGGLVESEETYVGGNTLSGVTNGFGIINVSGTDSTWRSTQNTFIGYKSNGTVNVTNGGTAETGQAMIGRFTSANALTGEGTRGIVNVDGPGSTFSSSSSIWVGLPNEGTFFQGLTQAEGVLNVRNGGRVEMPHGLQLAARNKASGIVNLSDSGSNITTGFVYLGKTSTTTSARDSSARLVIANSGILDVLGFDDGGGGPTRYTDIYHGNIDLDNGTINSPEVNIYGAQLVEITDPFVIGDDSASVTGEGIINGNVNNFGGIIGPGHSAGILDINGDLTQGNDGTLAIELGGLLRGTEYDFLDISGSAILDGMLDIALIDGFVATTGDEFDVLTANDITVNGLTWGGMGNFDLQIVSGGNGQVLRLSTTAIPEPNAIWLMAIAGCLLVCLRRKRTNSITG